jgi:hypothetical protein
MDSTHKAKYEPALPSHRFLAYLPQDWIFLLFGLYRALRLFLRRERHEGMYEILEYDSTLELVDPKGETAIFKRRERVKFLQDNVIAFQDRAWGDGEIFADYKCSPGIEVDRYQEGDRWNVLISLRETKSAGDVEDFYIERTVRSGFTKDEEWRQTEIRHRTRKLKLSIIFPKKRRCRRAVLMERNRNRTTELDPRYFTDLPDGRQVLTWEISKPRRFEIYTIKWKW